MDLDIATGTGEGACVLTLTGEVDVYTAPKLRESLIEANDTACEAVVVDMTGVDFIDSSGLGVLVSALKRIRERGAVMRIVCDRESILKIFQITGLDRVFGISRTLAEALEPEA
jgi:anti-sigma B factor antagonist